MPKHLHIDFETFSEADLKSVGAWRYAHDKSSTILCTAMAIGDEYPVIWHQGIREEIASGFDPYWDALEDPDVLIFAHNAQFEMAISAALLEKTWGIKPPALHRWRCTASLARRAALPAKLEMLAVALNLTNLKDKRGASLIRKFSVMQPAKKPSKKNPQGVPPRRIMPEDDPEAFSDFLKYCQQDTIVERDVAKRLAYFGDDLNNANYSLDAVINARGVTVNLDALRHAQKIIEEETQIVSAKFRALTGFEITQGARLLAWLHSQGAHLENLQAETVEAFLEPFETVDAFFEQEHSDAVLALQMKQSVAYASIKKIPKMLECAGPHDNRIRGMLVHHSATTGRWSSNLVQLQNMARPTIKNSEEAYRDICAGISREMLDIVYGPPLEVIGSCIRHFVHDVQTCIHCNGTREINLDGFGHKCPYCVSGQHEQPFLDADFSAIEARIVNWLAGQEDALEEYRQGIDRYKRMASVIYGIPENEVNKHPQRFVGKQAVLLCGFQGGAPKFRATCKKMGGYDLPAGLEDAAVQAFRSKHKQVVKYWYDVERAAKRAILQKGDVIELRNIAFLHRDIEGLPFLLLRLPSGRKLAYPRPRLVPSQRFEGALSIIYFGNIIGTQWGDVTTYAGSLVENITQAVAADLMAHGAHQAEKNGYAIATLIHDQALAYYKEGQTVEGFVRCLTDLPSWAKNLPIEAEGSLVPFYRKD